MGKKKNLRSLTVTLALAFFALIVVVLLISSSLNIYFRLQTQEKVIADQQEHIAEDAANTVKNFIQEKFTLLKATASFSNLTAAQKEEQELALARLLRVEPAFRQSVLLDTQEQELVRVSRLSISLSAQLMKYNKSELFSKVSRKETYICSIYIDAISSEPMIVMAVPVTDVFGNFKGVLMAEVNLKFMWDLVDSIKVGDTGVAYVVDMEGNLIAFGDTSRVLKGENLKHLDEVNEFVDGNELAHESESEISKGILGDDVVTTHVHLDNPKWAVVVELPTQEAYEDVILELRLSVLVMFLCFVLAVVIGIYLSKRITKPIIKLRDATREISKGNLDTKITVKSKDEIGDLATSFNQMTSDLKQSKRKLEEYSRTLEDKVKERTTELMTTNMTLRTEITERKRAEEALQKTMRDLKRFNRLAVGREHRMIELKREVNDLLHSMGRQQKFETPSQRKR